MPALFQHTAARRRLRQRQFLPWTNQCFNTQPRGGGCLYGNHTQPIQALFQHTAARRRLHITKPIFPPCYAFQHTAARRRLPLYATQKAPEGLVSTHSRAEAAAKLHITCFLCIRCFNTQPRGGGCLRLRALKNILISFNTQPRGGSCTSSNAPGMMISRFNTQPRGGGCLSAFTKTVITSLFQHTAARRRLLALTPFLITS